MGGWVSGWVGGWIYRDAFGQGEKLLPAHSGGRGGGGGG